MAGRENKGVIFEAKAVAPQFALLLWTWEEIGALIAPELSLNYESIGRNRGSIKFCQTQGLFGAVHISVRNYGDVLG